MEKGQQLEYEPKEVNPKGRPRIFFYSHKEDFELYFDIISKEVWSIVNNATVWFWNNTFIDEIDDEQVFDDLEQMQLLVIPITSQLLYGDDVVSKQIFMFAHEKYIPILPIMMEPGLEGKFNQKFGDFQILDHNNTDPTSIPYIEKAKFFLQSVLVSSELVDKIKMEFIGNIFLSYRKIDRIYAQKIMKLIHSQVDFQDIGIWYDEYLIPGENFNSAINDEMVRCDMVVLAVSPNLLIANNYVMTIEYPKAMSYQKAILPIEVIQTDYKLISQKYNKISQFVHIENVDEIISFIKSHLCLIGNSQKNNDPYHKYYIGMAYLNGIEVEVNRERAVKLIADSARAGVYEAFEQLTNMYYYEKGVKREIQKAIEWQERYVLRLENDFNGSLDVELYIKLVRQLNKLSYWQYEQNMIASAKNTILKIIQIANLMYENNLVCYVLGKTNIQLGDIYFNENNFSLANKYYFEALKLLEKCDRKNDSLNCQIDIEMASLYLKIANLKQKNKIYMVAKKFYIKSIKLYEENVIGEISVTNLIECYIGLAKIGVELKNLEYAKKWYYIAFNKVSERNVHISNLGSIAAGMGEIYMMENNTKLAKEWYERAVKIEKIKVDNWVNFLNKRNLSVYYDRLGQLEYLDGKYELAKKNFIKCMEIRELLYQEYNSQTHGHLLYEIYTRIGEICLKKDFYEAIKWLQKGLEICTLKEKENSNFDTMLDLFLAYAKLGDAHSDAKEYSNAKIWYHKQIEIGFDFAFSSEDEFEIYASEDKFEIYDISEFPDIVKEGMRHACFWLGTIGQIENDNVGALEWYGKCLKLCELLVSNNRNEDNLRELRCCYERMGNVASEQGEYAKAKEWYENNIDICIELLNDYNKIEDNNSFWQIYKKINDINKMVRVSVCEDQKEEKYSEWSDWKVYRYSDDDNVNWTCTDTYQIQSLGIVKVQTGKKELIANYTRYIYQEFSTIEYVLPEGKKYEIFATLDQISAHDYSGSLCEVLSDWEQTDETLIWHRGERHLVPTIENKWELDGWSIVNDKIEFVYRKYVRKVKFVSDRIGSGSKKKVPIYRLMLEEDTISYEVAIYKNQHFFRERVRTVSD